MLLSNFTNLKVLYLLFFYNKLTKKDRMKTLNDFDFKNKKALIRVDFNVPLDENFNVTDATRIEAAKPTIDAILAQGEA
jgi:phosphoglycerate kinase